MRSSLKILWLFFLILFCALTVNPIYLGICFFCLLFLSLYFGINVKPALASAFVFSVPLLLMNLFFLHSGTHIIFSIPKTFEFMSMNIPIPLFGGNITWEAFVWGMIFMLLLICMFLLFTIFNAIVSFDEVLRQSPAHFCFSALLFSIAIRYVPTVFSDANSVMDSQKCRGLKFKSDGLVQNLKSRAGVFVPVLVNSLERSYNLSESIESRGYTRHRTNYYRKPWTLRDWIGLILLFSTFFSLLYFKYSGFLEFAEFSKVLDSTWQYNPYVAAIILILTLAVMI